MMTYRELNEKVCTLCKIPFIDLANRDNLKSLLSTEVLLMPNNKYYTIFEILCIKNDRAIKNKFQILASLVTILGKKRLYITKQIKKAIQEKFNENINLETAN